MAVGYCETHELSWPKMFVQSVYPVGKVGCQCLLPEVPSADRGRGSLQGLIDSRGNPHRMWIWEDS